MNEFETACLLVLAMTAGNLHDKDQWAKPGLVDAACFVCSPERESRADEIVKFVLASACKRHVA